MAGLLPERYVSLGHLPFPELQLSFWNQKKAMSAWSFLYRLPSCLWRSSGSSVNHRSAHSVSFVPSESKAFWVVQLLYREGHKFTLSLPSILQAVFLLRKKELCCISVYGRVRIQWSHSSQNSKTPSKPLNLIKSRLLPVAGPSNHLFQHLASVIIKWNRLSTWLELLKTGQMALHGSSEWILLQLHSAIFFIKQTFIELSTICPVLLRGLGSVWQVKQ